MNLLGKALTVMIFIAAMVAVIGSLAVYSTHRNWKADADKLNEELSAAQNQNEQLESKYRNLETQLTAEIEIAQQEIRKLEEERVVLDSATNRLQEDKDKLAVQLRESNQALNVTQQNNETRAKEVAVLRDDLRENQQQRDVALAKAINKTDEWHQAHGELTALNERHTQLVQELSTKTALLRENGVDPDTDLEDVVPSVRGVVSKMHRTAASQLIEVTVGADDGLKPGHTIEVFRGDRYLGRAEILRTEPDRAVGRVIRRFQQGPIQEGDDVATKLRIG